MPKPRCDHKQVEKAPHRVGERRFTYFRCLDCGQEWTSEDHVSDLSETVTSDEILEVHVLLEGEKSLKELLP